MYYLKNQNFWIFGSFFFLYFFIIGAYFPFFPIWLGEIHHVSKSNMGIIFASISFFALVFQPVFGLLSDKFGTKKHLLWIIVGMLVLFGPFFIFVLGPLLKVNIYLASIVGGFYLGFIYNGGAPAIEAYIEKVSRHNHFEFGRARMFGCVGWAICASVVGYMMTINNEFVFWMGSVFAIFLAILLFLSNPESKKTQGEQVTPEVLEKPFDIHLALQLFKNPKLWFLSLFVIGVSCTYDVFDQQFANFFVSFFTSEAQGTRAFGYVTTLGELLNALVMFFTPLIINRIGPKNGLLIAGFIMSVRILGSAFATSVIEVIILKTLHMFEVPFLIVGCFKYITTVFETRFSATIYLVCFCFFKQIAIMFMSILTGNLYETIGFQDTYIVLGIIAFSFSIVSIFTLTGGDIDVNKTINKQVPIMKRTS